MIYENKMYTTNIRLVIVDAALILLFQTEYE